MINEKIENFIKAKKYEGLSRGHIEVLQAYRQGKEAGHENELLNLGGSFALWPEDAGDMLEALKSYGIKAFTLSETSTALMELLAVFTAGGCRIMGMTKINAGTDWNGATRKVDAIKLEIVE